MRSGEILRFIVGKNTADRMDRVIMINKGTIAEKSGSSDGVRYHVVKL